MTTLVKITVAIFLALFVSSCGFDLGSGIKGNGNIVEDSRSHNSDFSTISSSEGIQVYITQSNKYSIEVKADENVIDLIATDIENGKLRIHAIQNIGRATKEVYISLPNLEKLKGSSGSHIVVKNSITSDNLEIDASSGAHINIDADCNTLQVDASSGAHITLTGQANKLRVDGSSGAHIKAKELEVAICNAEASSGSHIKVNVSKSLHANASSGGNIAYKGNPNVESKKSVSGSVNQM